MKTSFNEEKLNLIRKQIDIVDVISKYLKLEKRGKNYVSICPFHDDSHPSMSISKEKQIYKCFSCNASGDAFQFVMDFEKLNFIEALKQIGKITNITLEGLENYQAKSDYDERAKTLIKINKDACAFLMNNLHTPIAENAQIYLTRRKIDIKQVEQFKIGYATGNDLLVKFLEKKGYKIADIIACGLGNEKDNNLKDYFINRLIFPIENNKSDVIGFSARSLSDDVKPKYINTSETYIFKKDQVMYNFFNAKNYIRLKQNLIILEGFIDVISLWKIGIKNTIALMGTNLSKFHMQEIKKVTNNIILFLDGDEAGIKATIKIVASLLHQGLIVKVVDNQSLLDPDELVNQNKLDLIETMLDKPIHPINYVINYLKQKLNLQDGNDIKFFIKTIEPLVSSLNNDKIEQEIYFKLISTTLNVDVEVLKQQLNTVFQEHKKEYENQFKEQSTSFNRTRRIIKDGYHKAEEELILKMIYSRKASDFYQSQDVMLNDAFNLLLVNSIIEQYKQDNRQIVDVTSLKTQLDDVTLVNILDDIINNSLISRTYNEKALLDYLERIKEKQYVDEINNLKRKQKMAQNWQSKLDYGDEVITLSKKLKKGGQIK